MQTSMQAALEEEAQLVPQASIKIGFALVVETIILDATLTAVSAELQVPAPAMAAPKDAKA